MKLSSQVHSPLYQTSVQVCAMKIPVAGPWILGCGLGCAHLSEQVAFPADDVDPAGTRGIGLEEVI